MAVESIAVWSIRPDWADGSIETLSWLTSTTESPQAVEQRMGLRISPRHMFEHTYTVFNGSRTHFDLLNMAAAGSPFYLPLWHDRGLLTAAVSIGATVLSLDTRWTEFQNCRYAILVNDEYNFEIVEISSFTDSTLTLAAGLTNGWPIRTEIFPVKKCRVESQFNGERHVDRALKGRMRFLSMEANDSIAVPVVGTYLGNYVLEDEPNEASPLSYNFNRKEYLLDTGLGKQLLSDVAPFVNQSHAWFAKGRERAWRLRGLLYALQGKRRPIWVPSFLADFDLAEAAGLADTVLTVNRCGFTDTGGPFLHRDHILIHMRDGTRLYRKIISSAIVGAEGLYEVIELDSAAGIYLTPDNILRISFMTFCRLDQDSIELIHHSDSKGLTTASLVWRTDPGIGGTYSETTTEVPPHDPESPSTLTVIDPFRRPANKLWLYAPYGSQGIAAFDPDRWSNVGWHSRRPDVDTGFDSDEFPSHSIDGFGALVTLPDSGSFLIRTGLYFTRDFDPPSRVWIRILFLNSNLDPVETFLLVGAIDEGLRTAIQSGREDIYSAKLDKDQPLQVRIQIQAEGEDDPSTLVLGGNVHSVANPTNDAEPYHGDASAAGGDSYFIIEWWPP